MSYVPRVVSAAMLMDDGLIVPGVRHFSPDMRAVLGRIYGPDYKYRVEEQGFIDSKGKFLNRRDALHLAHLNGQFLKQMTTMTSTDLFSEDLY